MSKERKVTTIFFGVKLKERENEEYHAIVIFLSSCFQQIIRIMQLQGTFCLRCSKEDE